MIGAEDLVSSKTFTIEKLNEVILDHSQDHPDIGTFEFYKLLMKHAMEKGELKSDISIETAALFTRSIMESLGRFVLNHRFAGPLEKEAKEFYDEFFSILRDGLADTDQ